MGAPSGANKERGARQEAGGESQGKKTVYWYTRFGKIGIEEQIFRQGRAGAEIRPFSLSAEVECRGYSQLLQRAITDFGADDPFVGATKKLREHYGIEVPISSARAITERHGETMLKSQRLETELPDRPGVPQLIAEIDGSFIPVVETRGSENAQEKVDRRKTRQLGWKEARLSLAHEPGSVTPSFGATMGTADEAGEQLLHCAIRAGAGSKTKFHCLGDGAVWITDQVDLMFGTQASFLVDFSHLCEYLGAAGESIAGQGKEAWTEEKKQQMKENRWPDVLKSLEPFLENDKVPEENASVRRCHRYIANRTRFLDYQTALAADLPIGSGEVESAHRYVFQARLKIAGAWWKIENAKKMIALRVLRANGDWEAYWNRFAQKAA